MADIMTKIRRRCSSCPARENLGKTGCGNEQGYPCQLGSPMYPELAETVVYKHMKQQIPAQSIIHADETVVQVLKEGYQPAASESHM